MWPKERGYILSVDPASCQAGVSLWRNGQLVAGRTLGSAALQKSTMSVRLRVIYEELDEFLNAHVPGDELVHTVLLEGVQSHIVKIVQGVFFLPGKIDSGLKNSQVIQSAVWKSWARAQGATPPDDAKGDSYHYIKGIDALAKVGWDMRRVPIDTDDVADSVLIYLAWRDRKDKRK